MLADQPRFEPNNSTQPLMWTEEAFGLFKAYYGPDHPLHDLLKPVIHEQKNRILEYLSQKNKVSQNQIAQLQEQIARQKKVIEKLAASFQLSSAQPSSAEEAPHHTLRYGRSLSF